MGAIGEDDYQAVQRSLLRTIQREAAGMLYHEVAPQLVLMAYLQSIVKGTGFLDREYGVGRGRIDLQLRWPYTDAQGQRQWQREAIEAIQIRVCATRSPIPWTRDCFSSTSTWPSSISATACW